MLDPARVRADADAHAARLDGPAWSDHGDPGLAARAIREAQSVVIPPARSEPRGPAVVQRKAAHTLDEPGKVAHLSSRHVGAVVAPSSPPLTPPSDLSPLLTTLIAQVRMLGSSEGTPGWLLESVGVPRTYDCPTRTRRDVCVRLDAALYERLVAAQRRHGLRSMAGMWEYVVRAGLGVADRGVGL